MRIISGSFKSKKILEPKDKKTRPLKDLTKESIFNIIRHSNKFRINFANSFVLDLFSGVGNFALAMARQGAAVTGIEGSELMVARAQQNARDNKLDALHFLAADLSNPLILPAAAPAFTAALLDPPRDGAQQLVLDLAELGVKRILYISCNPATLARDAGILATKGYSLVKAGVMDMFPQTSHVEAMALFRKH